MELDVLIPITLFICIAYAIKAVVDARVRLRMVGAGGSEELVRSLVQGEERRRRHASLHWGLVLSALAIGFAVIELSGWRALTAGMIAVLVGATGLGNLVFFAIARRVG